VVLEFLLAFQVHVAAIPLVAERRYRVQAPVDEDAELAVDIPRLHGIALERRPVRRKETLWKV
jgi:hypothetical protein